jgi:hypothetical protein
MIEDMTVRKLGSATQRNYIRAVKTLSEFLGRSPASGTPNRGAGRTRFPSVNALSEFSHSQGHEQTCWRVRWDGESDSVTGRSRCSAANGRLWPRNYFHQAEFDERAVAPGEGSEMSRPADYLSSIPK